MTEFALRPMSPIAGERSFIARSWVESHSSSAMARLITASGNLPEVRAAWRPGTEYWQAWNALVNSLLDRARTTVAVDDAGLIAGFVCWEPWENAVAIHYVYTRLMYRKQGVARRLVESLPRGPIFYTHRSRGIGRVPEGWQYTIRPILGPRPSEAA